MKLAELKFYFIQIEGHFKILRGSGMKAYLEISRYSDRKIRPWLLSFNVSDILIVDLNHKFL